MADLPKWATEHLDYMSQLGLDRREIDEVRDDLSGDNKTEVPSYEQSQFMRFCWTGVIDANLPKGWLKRSANLDMTSDDVNEGVLEFYDECDLDELRRCLQRIDDCGVNEDDLLYVIREAQKNVLGAMFMMIDGGADGCTDAHLFETTNEDGELVPKRPFSSMEDYFIDYDPKHLNSSNSDLT